MKKLSQNAKLGASAVFLLILVMFAYFFAPVASAQPGDAEDPLVTRRFVEERIDRLSEEIAALWAVVGGASPVSPQIPDGSATVSPQDQTAIIAEIYRQLELSFGERIAALEGAEGTNFAAQNEPQIVPFRSINLQPGQSITFDAGAEFILRSGSATAIAPSADVGIPDVTAGRDVLNGQSIGQNHLMIIPRTDGRGVIFHSSSWIMVRGGYTIFG